MDDCRYDVVLDEQPRPTQLGHPLWVGARCAGSVHGRYGDETACSS